MKAPGFRRFIWSLPGILFSLSVLSQEKISIEVEVTGARAGEGQILLSIFDSPESFLKSPIRDLTSSVDQAGIARLQVKNILPGWYALSIIYDEDNNGELNTGLFGIPSELVGFSNNARGVFGPPSFEKARIELLESGTIEIQLKKAKD